MKDKATKRAEAEERQKRHDELSSIEKLTKCERRPGESKAERDRLMSAVTGEKLLHEVFEVKG